MQSFVDIPEILKNNIALVFLFLSSFLHLCPPGDQKEASLISTLQIVLSVCELIGENENMTFSDGVSNRKLQVHWSGPIKA